MTTTEVGHTDFIFFPSFYSDERGGSCKEPHDPGDVDTDTISKKSSHILQGHLHCVLGAHITVP